MTHDPRLDQIHQAIAAIAERLNAPPVRWVSVKGAAEYSSLSEKSIRGLLAARKLTPYRAVRGKILIDIRELDCLIAGSTAVPRTSRGSATRSREQ